MATFLTLYLLVMWLPSLMAAKELSRPDAAVVQMLYSLGSTVAAFATGYALDKKYVYSVPAVGYIILAVVLFALGMIPIGLFLGMVLGFLLGVGVTTRQTLIVVAPIAIVTMLVVFLVAWLMNGATGSAFHPEGKLA